MPDYEYSKIYKITSPSRGLCYIGSTTQSLSMRMSGHRRHYKHWLKGKGNYCSSFEVLQHEDAKIELIKKFSCKSKKELHEEEGKYIKEIECVNKYIPGRTIKEYRKEKYEKNKKEILKQRKEYRQKNKKKIAEKKKVKYNCFCGGKYIHNNKRVHFKSRKHLEAHMIIIDDNSVIYIHDELEIK